MKKCISLLLLLVNCFLVRYFLGLAIDIPQSRQDVIRELFQLARPLYPTGGNSLGSGIVGVFVLGGLFLVACSWRLVLGGLWWLVLAAPELCVVFFQGKIRIGKIRMLQLP